MATRKVKKIDDIFKIKKEIIRSMITTMESLRTELNKKERDYLKIFYEMKFSQVGHDFITTDGEYKNINLIEQLNRSYSDLAVCEGGIYLFNKHIDIEELILRFGVTSGIDITSNKEIAAAEVFTTVDLRNNKKLETDAEKISQQKHGYKHKYIIYYSPRNYDSKEIEKKYKITIEKLDLKNLMREEE